MVLLKNKTVIYIRITWDFVLKILRGLKWIWQKLVLSPWVGAIVAVSAIIAGSIASIATDEIRASIGYSIVNNIGQWDISKINFSLSALIFWSCVAATGLLFTFNKAAEIKAQEDVIDKQISGHDRLEKAINRLATLPNDTLLLAILVKYKISANAIHLVDKIISALRHEFMNSNTNHNSDHEDARQKFLNELLVEVDEGIRKILSILIDLSIIFDESVNNEEYGANIMILCTQSSFETNSVRLEGKLPKILGTPSKLDNSWMGVLEGFKSLSASNKKTVEDGNYPIDDDLEEIALPVPTMPADAELQNSQILPGAPLSLIGNRFIGYPNIKYFLTEVENYYDANHSTSIKAYFESGSGRRIRSFISVPIPNVFDSEQVGHGVFLGVLNIHSNKADILLNGESLFWPVIQPFIISIGQLLMRRNNLDNEVNSI